MKILRVKIKRDQTAERTRYTYPPEYDAMKIQVLCYESGLPGKLAEVIARGNKDEYLLGTVKDIDAPAFLANPDIVEITKVEAITIGNQWTGRSDKILDRDKVLMIVAKMASGKVLEQREKDSINPDHSEKGINKSRSFEEGLNEYLSK